MKAGLTFACMNLKKLAKILEKRGWNTARFLLICKRLIFRYVRKIPALWRGFQTVDKALLLQGFAIVGTAFLL